VTGAWTRVVPLMFAPRSHARFAVLATATVEPTDPAPIVNTFDVDGSRDPDVTRQRRNAVRREVTISAKGVLVGHTFLEEKERELLEARLAWNGVLVERPRAGVAVHAVGGRATWRVVSG
jgi:hypothetical protein